MRKEIDALLKNFVSDGDAASAELAFPAGFSGFQGHFPEQPVLPGVCQLTLAMVMADRMCGKRMKMGAATNAKFVAMVVPDQPLEIKCTLADGTLSASLTSKGERVGQFKLKVEHA
ncbi:hypothetical protein PDESU_00589 [Pontiella desulfatans]|uniref:ApeI dehydratase-like domain-containing protein n=1 Tax=Pontiella desulfatans TaxID=2750659 RepID=A0A6C2TWI7_PONDE|nr:hypothetical protein [Pontiella desulfatans]VGO12040.1 hypothetical protein PDESU_00589 [Pontiella desulfatans]